MLKDRGREGMGLLPAGRDVPQVPSVKAGALGVAALCSGGCWRSCRAALRPPRHALRP